LDRSAARSHPSCPTITTRLHRSALVLLDLWVVGGAGRGHHGVVLVCCVPQVAVLHPNITAIWDLGYSAVTIDCLYQFLHLWNAVVLL
jgi:hypothetical protein